MKKHLKTALWAGLFAAAAGPAMAECAVDFDKDVQKIFDRRCVACHNNAAPGSDLSLQRGASLDHLIGVASLELDTMPRVSPGDPENSYLFHKLNGTQADVGGSGENMPLNGRLREGELDLIVSWISDCVEDSASADTDEMADVQE